MEDIWRLVITLLSVAIPSITLPLWRSHNAAMLLRQRMDTPKRCFSYEASDRGSFNGINAAAAYQSLICHISLAETLCI